MALYLIKIYKWKSKTYLSCIISIFPGQKLELKILATMSVQTLTNRRHPEAEIRPLAA